MRAIVVVATVAFATIGAIVACSSFSESSGDGETPADGASHEGGEPPADGAPPSPLDAGGDATAPPCPLDASTVFEDDFDQPYRPTLRYRWTAAIDDPGTDLWIDGGSLFAHANAQTSGEARAVLRYAFTAPSKRICLELRATIVRPASFAEYNGGQTDIVYVASTPTAGDVNVYHGILLDSDGPQAFYDGVDAVKRDVVQFGPGALVVIDIDYVTGNAAIAVDGDVRPLPSSWPIDAGLPAPVVVVGVDQQSVAPDVEIDYGSVRASVYE